ncbi:hypothetical protein IAT40_007573 [Kwoniella sp. CBS 6097]
MSDNSSWNGSRYPQITFLDSEVPSGFDAQISQNQREQDALRDRYAEILQAEARLAAEQSAQDANTTTTSAAGADAATDARSAAADTGHSQSGTGGPPTSDAGA